DLGRGRFLAVGRGGSGRGPARSVVHHRSFTVPVRGCGGSVAAIVPWGGCARSGRGRTCTPSIVRAPGGRLAAWLISTRTAATPSGRPRSRRSAGTSHPKGPFWSCSTRSEEHTSELQSRENLVC